MDNKFAAGPQPSSSTRLRSRPPHQPAPSERRSADQRSFFFIRHQGRYLKINHKDIHYIEARKNYCKFATTGGNYLALVTLKRMEAVLPTQEFCRIHRAFIVSLDWISSFDSAAVYGRDAQLPIGDTYRRSLHRCVLLLGEEGKKRTEKMTER
jgi:DNA-binding LytR/AlgR family response regulator